MTSTSANKNRLPISVIIAMYNTEKYIGECLDSFVEQTFKEFEVIVIDDCSTDNGNSIVRSYMSKFNGRLKLVRLKKNSGNNGIPNNMGLALSRGEYVLFMDSDDIVTPDALEKLYIVAKEFDADVVSCEKYYNVPEESWRLKKNLEPTSYQTGGFVREPTLITEDFSKRVKLAYQRRFIWNIWSKLIRRDFLVDNEISITNEMCNDMLLSLFLIYSAKRFVRVPYVMNYYRVLDSSITHQKREPLQQMKKYLRALTVGLRHLDNFLSKRDFFQKNPDVKYLALDTYWREIWNFYIQKVYDKIPAPERTAALHEEFAKDDNTALQTFLFDVLANMLIANKNAVQINSKLRPYLTARIDIQLMKFDDFRILSVSDEKANISKPGWFQKNGVGYVINSFAGNVEFVAKANVDGQVRLGLRGMDIKDPKDKSKRIPYWIDYAKLIINGKTIFDTLTPAWHNKSYWYKIDAKADEEIKIEVEWLPHRSDT